MARYTGPSCRYCRAEKRKLFLKGERCSSAKCPINKKRPAPGKDAKARIKLSKSQEADFQLYADTLRSVLKDSTIYINGIRYDKHERLVDYTDRTDIIKSAHFRKDGSIRITDDQRMLSIEDARNLKIKWKKVR